MGKIIEAKRKLANKAEQAVIKNVIKQLEVAIELKEKGQEEEGDKVVNDTIAWLEEKIRLIDNQLEKEEKLEFNRNIFQQFGEIIAEGERVILSAVKEEEKEDYLSVSYENTSMKECYKEEQFRDEIWKDFMSEKAFVCSIYDKATQEYIGYCSIKDLEKEEWEIAIEIKSDKCHQGYGTDSLKVFMKEIYKLTSKRYFRARVEIDNYASQGLMKKLGAKENGISEFLIYGEEIEKFKEENKHLITEKMRKVAEEFCMEAEDILGYVLEYRFDMHNI